MAQKQAAIALRAEDAAADAQRAAGQVVFGRVRGATGEGLVVHPDYTVEFGLRFSTVGTAEVRAGAGKVFYEVQLLELPAKACVQFGWASGGFDLSNNSAANEGVGDDDSSWGVDGLRVKIWGNGAGADWGERWEVGDTIGCAADVDGGTLLFGRNGKWSSPMGLAFKGLRARGGLLPALSGKRARVRVNLGDQPWAHGPPDEAFMGVSTASLVRVALPATSATPPELELEVEATQHARGDSFAGRFVRIYRRLPYLASVAVIFLCSAVWGANRRFAMHSVKMYE